MRKDVLLWTGRMGAAFVIALLVNQWMNNSVLALSVVETTMYFSVLFFGYRYGAGTGALVGTACGIIETLTGNTLAPLAMLSLGGTFAGAFRKLGRMGSCLGFLAGVAGACFLYAPEQLQRAALELLAGTVLFFLLPSGLLQQSGEEKEEKLKETVNGGYEAITVKKVRNIAEAFEKLSKTFPVFKERDTLISDEEGEEIFKRTSRDFCGSCRACALYNMGGEENQYYLHYLLHLFEKNGELSGEELPKLFRQLCRDPEKYLGMLNEELGRARQNCLWKNRYYESREAVSAQFSEFGRLLSRLTEELSQAEDVTGQVGKTFRRILRMEHLKVKEMLVLEHGNGRQEAFLTVQAGGGRCVTVKEAAQRLEKGTGRRWQPADLSKSVVGKEPCHIQLLEEPSYGMLHGVARASKDGEEVSGDTFSYTALPKGRVLLCLSDGCGSGRRAYGESEAVIELTEQLLETGISPVAAAKMVNSVLLLKNEEQLPTTMDMAVVDLYTGQCELVKLGAAASFLIKRQDVILISTEQLPMGIFREIEDASLTLSLEDGDFIVMMTDGVLEGFPGGDKEKAAAEFLKDYGGSNPKELAERILKKALGPQAKARDDMTVLVAGFWKK